MLIFGFKFARFRQWAAVLREELRRISARDRLQVLLHIVWVGLGIGRVGREEWRSRMRGCRVCPLFDPRLRRCRPWTGHPAGCGCYTPFLALGPDGCWGHANPGEVTFGDPGRRRVVGWGPVKRTTLAHGRRKHEDDR